MKSSPKMQPITPEQSQSKREALGNLLEQEVAKIQSSEAFQRYLMVQARFHLYSWGNCMLILLQRPEATRVAGYRTWQSLGRQVRKGERGIAILAPHRYTRQDDTGEDKTEVGFHVEHVFDISQTDGRDLPSIAVNPLDDAAGRPLVSFEQLATFAVSIGSPVTHHDPLTDGDDSRSSYRGYFDRRTKAIFVKRQPLPMMFKVLAHELAHALDPDLLTSPQDERETVAEGTAFIVSEHFGLDTGAYSFRYVAGWCGRKDGAEVLRRVMGRIQKIAHQIVDGVESLQQHPA